MYGAYIYPAGETLYVEAPDGSLTPFVRGLCLFTVRQHVRLGERWTRPKYHQTHMSSRTLKA